MSMSLWRVNLIKPDRTRNIRCNNGFSVRFFFLLLFHIVLHVSKSLATSNILFVVNLEYIANRAKKDSHAFSIWKLEKRKFYVHSLLFNTLVHRIISTFIVCSCFKGVSQAMTLIRSFIIFDFVWLSADFGEWNVRHIRLM